MGWSLREKSRCEIWMQTTRTFRCSSREIALRNLDANDPHIPLLLWWAIEKHSFSATEQVIEFFTKHDLWKIEMGREFILPRVMQRFAAEGTQQGFDACARLMAELPSFVNDDKMFAALDEGLPSPTRLKSKESYAKLENLLASISLDDWNVSLVRVRARLGNEPAQKLALDVAADSKKSNEHRIAMIQLIGQLGQLSDAKMLLQLIAPRESEAIQIAALDALQQIPNAPMDALLKNYPQMSAPVRSKLRDIFLSRKEWGREFLSGIDAGKFKPSEIPLEQLQKVALLNDKQLNDLVRKNWGNIGSGTPEEKLADIRRFNNDLRAFPGDAKNGHAVFTKSCAVCHELFGEGEKVGPELTHANRKDKDFLLASIVDPSAVVRKEFINYNIETSDGRVLNGLVAEQNGSSVTLAVAKNEKTTVSRDKIVSMRESEISLMPEGLMHGLTPQERRDLFSYLQSEK
jgi:putative heme-binding domain-containing protein